MPTLLLQLDGLNGGSSAEGHEKWIELDSYSWDMRNAVNLHRGEQMATSAVAISNITCYKLPDTTSAELQARCCSGEPFKFAKIHVTRTAAGKKPTVFMKIKISPVVIASFCGDSNVNAERSTENFSMHFAKCSVQYTWTNGQTTDFGWDIAKNQKMAVDV